MDWAWFTFLIFQVAAPEIAMIKVVAPRMCLSVVDRAIQAHGGAGLHSDLPLGQFYTMARALRFADGPGAFESNF